MLTIKQERIMNTNQAIKLARKHAVFGNAEMQSSARVCFEYAQKNYDDGNYDAARMWAAKCVCYVVGVFHKDYQRIAKTLNQ